MAIEITKHRYSAWKRSFKKQEIKQKSKHQQWGVGYTGRMPSNILVHQFTPDCKPKLMCDKLWNKKISSSLPTGGI